jgi:hypothetical protein
MAEGAVTSNKTPIVKCGTRNVKAMTPNKTSISYRFKAMRRLIVGAGSDLK